MKLLRNTDIYNIDSKTLRFYDAIVCMPGMLVWASRD